MVIVTDNLKDMTVLHKRYRKFAVPATQGGWMDSWMRDTLKAQKRKEDKEAETYRSFSRLLRQG